MWWVSLEETDRTDIKARFEYDTNPLAHVFKPARVVADLTNFS